MAIHTDQCLRVLKLSDSLYVVLNQFDRLALLAITCFLLTCSITVEIIPKQNFKVRHAQGHADHLNILRHPYVHVTYT